MTPEEVVIIDWSGGLDRGPRPCRDAIWIGDARGALYCRNRQVAEEAILSRIDAALAAGRRVLLGFDFPFACPRGFARAITGSDDPFALWDWIAARLSDGPKGSNRLDVAGEMNALFPGIGPFWGNTTGTDHPHVPRKGRLRDFRWPDPRRQTELAARGTFECWQLFGAGAVGSQMITGMPVLSRLRARHGARAAVWPFEPCGSARLILAEVFPTLIDSAVRAALHSGRFRFRDEAQVTLLAAALQSLSPGDWSTLTDVQSDAEGWILGAGEAGEILRAAAARI